MKKIYTHIGIWLSLMLHGSLACGTPQGKEPSDEVVAHITAVDALERQISTDSKRKEGDRYVGLFYFTWLGQHRGGQQGIFDISVLSKTNRSALFNRSGTPESPLGQYHFWGEPLYGYYDSSDPWVITRHIELLTMAGIDYVLLDATNSFYYPEVVTKLLDRLLEFKAQGWPVPAVGFYTNSHSGSTVKRIFEHFYRDGRYADAWFKPCGKPLIIGITPHNKGASDQTVGGSFTDFVSEELADLFDVRESQWPTGHYHAQAFPWISWDYPQRIHQGVVSVSVAQHSPVNIVFSDTVHTRGRGYDAIRKRNMLSGIPSGLNFQQQWETVFSRERQIENVFVTGWNEWIAIKSADAEKVFFVDSYNEEFSRDIEMMKEGYGDNYYLQLIANVKRFKYAAGDRRRSVLKTIDILDVDETQWEGVTAHFRDFEGDALPRNYPDFSGTGVYRDTSNRNDITDIKVANDDRNVYVYIRTKAPISTYNGTDMNWMNVFIGTDDGSGEDFGGFNYVINRFPKADHTTSVERSKGGYDWTRSGVAQYRVSGAVMQLSIPRSSLGLTAERTAFRIKVADNVTKQEDIMDYYVSGDSAPIGRLAYAYTN
ncbi:hypothetical protein SAMN05421747_11811 [Parapedobacter composti]|uniref:Uncharacterized protein n=1 Tax=Parapedobacter composti TaxID=623281 RepID=A0A1I1L0G6_9SPHI|nr:hypothetical protein [Parapedobacter composti]SFC66481.1 hypothetical protein SAMN05421747_11811 [Parapedobacter composti]